MSPGIERVPSEWGRRVVDVARAQGRNIRSVSIWHGTADNRVVPRNREELVEQWTAVHEINVCSLKIFC